MSQRFVKGYKLDTEKIYDILGSEICSYQSLKKSNKDILYDIENTLKADNLSIKDLISELNKNELKSKHANGYSRILEIILCSNRCVLDGYINLIESNFLNTESGDWNELLKSAGLIHLSELWANNNFGFPWKKEKPKNDWPCWTLIEKDSIKKILNEFKNFNKKKIINANSILFDEIDEKIQKEEIIEGLNIFKDWLDCVNQDDNNESLLLQMDGDQ